MGTGLLVPIATLVGCTGQPRHHAVAPRRVVHYAWRLGHLPRLAGERWRYGGGGPVIACVSPGGLAVVEVAPDGQGVLGVGALDLATGRRRWLTRTGDSGTDEITTSDGKTAYFGSESGRLYALDLKDGHLLWQVQATGAQTTRYADHPYWGIDSAIASAPAVTPGRLVVVSGVDARAYAFDTRTGKLRWSFAAQAPLHAGPCVVGDVVVIGALDGSIYGLDAANGRRRWISRIPGQIQATPVRGPSDVVYVLNSSEHAYAFHGDSGRLIWHSDFHWKRDYPPGPDPVLTCNSPVIAADGSLVVPTATRICKLSAKDGHPIWWFDPGTVLPLGPLGLDPLHGRYTYVSDPLHGWLYKLDLTSGRRVRRVKVGGMLKSPTVAPDGTVLIGSNTGYVLRLSL